MAFRTKKISQMDPKGANLASNDLLEISQLVSGSYVTKSITGAEIVAGVGTGFVPTTRTLTINGTTQDLSADRTFTISTGITIGTTAITSGTVGRVLFEGTGNVVSESANLFWDNTNGRLGIGTSSPTTIVHINGNTAGTAPSLQIRQQTNTTPTWFAVRNNDNLASTGAISLDIGISGGASQFFNGTAQGDIVLKAYSKDNTSKFFLGATSGSTAQMVLFPSTGNVGINTTTDAGYKLDVNGTARVGTSLDVNTGSGILANGANNPVVINSNYWSNGDGFVIASKNTTDSSPKLTLRANSAGSCSLQLYNNGNKSYIRQINTSGVGGQSVYLFQLDNRQAKLAVTADDSTTDASFFGKAIWDGGAAATFRASSATQTANIINVQNHDGTSTFLNVKPTGNVLINTTTDAGFKLDVNGTARFQSTVLIKNAYVSGGAVTSFSATFNDDSNGIQVLQGAIKRVALGNSGGDILLQGPMSSNISGTTRAYGLDSFGFRVQGNGQTSFRDDITNAFVNSSALVEMVSTSRGFLPPRMTQAQRNAIASPAIGLEIYQTDATEGKYIYKSSGWTYIG
jgi:hypothetical protein